MTGQRILTLSTGLVAALVSLALTSAPARSQSSETAVMAEFIPKFIRYVSWPAAAAPMPREPFHLCVIGRDPFGRTLDRAAEKERIDGRGVLVRRMPSVDRAAGCHLAFVQGSSPEETERLLRGLRGHSILTVTEGGSGRQRGMIHFILSRGRVRFFIDEAAAFDHRLSISSRLLALALGVRQRRP